jgi:hypothetical protein
MQATELVPGGVSNAVLVGDADSGVVRSRARLRIERLRDTADSREGRA